MLILNEFWHFDINLKYFLYQPISMVPLTYLPHLIQHIVYSLCTFKSFNQHLITKNIFLEWQLLYEVFMRVILFVNLSPFLQLISRLSNLLMLQISRIIQQSTKLVLYLLLEQYKIFHTNPYLNVIRLVMRMQLFFLILFMMILQVNIIVYLEHFFLLIYEVLLIPKLVVDSYNQFCYTSFISIALIPIIRNP